MVDIDQLRDQVDRARLKLWTERGVQLGLNFTDPFTEFLAEEMNAKAPDPDGPQPPMEIVGVATLEAEVVRDPDYSAHKFKPNRGGVNCLKCDMTESNGDHTE